MPARSTTTDDRRQQPRLRQVELRVVQHLADVSQPAWDALHDGDANPFVSWTFLEALEASGCAAPERGWWPCHLTAWQAGQLVAAAPAYVKADSAGDFSRDWGFADLVERAGVAYYPKLVIGVPFSPVSGRRILVHPEHDATAMTAAILTLARELARDNGLSSVHVLYHHADESSALAAAELAGRVLIQYHWRNRGFTSVDDWLRRLPSKKRTQARRERAEPARQGIALRTVRGDELAARPGHWAAEAYALYRNNTAKHFWGGAYLNQAFYQRLCERLAEHVELVVAERGGRVVAGAFNLATPSHLYGRYWGCHEEHRFLHFNVCLYHSIDECIARSVRVFEGGAGGEHKLARGFEPTAVHCAHYFLHPEVNDLMARLLRADSRAREQQLEQWRARNGQSEPAAGSQR